MSAIDVADLTKTYGDRLVVDRVSFSVEQGETVALLGHNGAGKTTTVEMVEGLRRPTSGNVRVLGHDPLHTDRTIRERVAVVLQETALWGSITVAEVIDLYAGMYPTPRKPDELLALMGLDDQSRSRVRELSGGQRRRLDLALGLVGHPDVLFLDEPTTGFDPAARRDAWRFVQALRESGTTILLTTHYMDEAEHLADRVLVMSHGSLIAGGTSADLSRQIGASSIITFRLPEQDSTSDLPRIDGRIDTFGPLVEIRTADPSPTLLTLLQWATDRGESLDALTVARPSLEDVYLELIGRNEISRADND